MSSRTQIVCLCEGKRGGIDGVFINRLIKSLAPSWIRPWPRSNLVRIKAVGGRKEVIAQLPVELRACLSCGGSTTLLVWADCDHDCPDGESLKNQFWIEAQRQGNTQEEFDQVIFLFAKDRLENWIEFLNTGKTDEGREGPRVKHSREAADAAKTLARYCKNQERPPAELPPSLQWSCRNWRALVARMSKD